MPESLEARLARIRGPVPPKRHNARTIAALTSNPGCARRGVLDAAGVDKERLARHIGFPARFGQSQFAITRGNAFEAQVKANGYAELIRLLREVLGLDLAEVGCADLESVGGNEDQDLRHARSRTMLLSAVQGRDDDRRLFDHPLLRFEVAGTAVYLEPDMVAFRHGGMFHIVEIKSFPVIDGQADPGKVAAAATQSAVYVLALRRLLGLGDAAVSHEVVLICPENFSNRPTATLVDVRKQLIVLEHQLARLTRIDTLLAALPDDLTLDLGDSGKTTRSAQDVLGALSQVEARYAPACLAACELAFFCRHEATGCTAALGTSVREELGGVETVAEALGLADGTLVPGEDRAEAAQLLRAAARLYDDVMSRAA